MARGEEGLPLREAHTPLRSADKRRHLSPLQGFGQAEGEARHSAVGLATEAMNATTHHSTDSRVMMLSIQFTKFPKSENLKNPNPTENEKKEDDGRKKRKKMILILLQKERSLRNKFQVNYVKIELL